MNDTYVYLLIKTVVTLVFVLGLMVLAFYSLRFFAGKRIGLKGRRSGNPVRVLTTTFLGAKRNLAVVDVAGELILIGMTPTSISYLGKVESPEAAEEIKKVQSGKTKPFFNLFQ